MNADSSFKSAQSKFFKWVTNWTVVGENSENNRTPDLLDLITIFQILGFTIIHADCFEPHEISKLKINISCSHSGLRFVLDGFNNCSCSQKMVNSVRQIMLHPEKEKKNVKYSNMPLLVVPEGEKLVIQTVLTHLVYMMHEAAKDNDQNQNMAKAKATKDHEKSQNIVEEENSQKTSLKIVTPSENYFTPDAKIRKQKIIEKKSPEVVMSPGRYRSLDTLTGKNILPDELPEPGQLSKDKTEKKSLSHKAYSSPSLSIPSEPSNTSSPIANIVILKQGYSKLLSVQELVKDVIEIFEKSQEIPSIDVSNIKASTKSLCAKKSTVSNSSSDSNLLVKRSIKPLCQLSTRSASSIKSTVTSSTTSSTLQKSNARKKSEENVSSTLKRNDKPSAVSSGTKSQKFAHVKSTIPKGNACKK